MKNYADCQKGDRCHPSLFGDLGATEIRLQSVTLSDKGTCADSGLINAVPES